MKPIHLFTLTLATALSIATAVAQEPPNESTPPGPPTAPEAPMPPGGPEASPDAATPPPPPEAMPATASEPAQPEAEPAPAQSETKTGSTDSTPVTIEASTAKNIRSDVANPFTPPEQPVGNGNPDGIVMNFKNAPLEMVLNYLSDAAGFIIVLDTRVNGNVSIISSHPMTKDEAVDLLNSVLNKNGYAAIRSGRTLTIVDKNDAKSRNIPVKSSNRPEDIPDNAEIVTQIIPIRFVEARQLVSDLTSFVSPQATVVANEAGNAIVVTDTQSNIRHLTEIIRAIDNSAQTETEIRVFRLKYASPADVASELTSIFPSSTSGGNTQSPIRFGGGFGGGGGGGGFFQRMMGGGGGNNSSSSSSDRVKKATQVSAVADSRIQAVIVTAPKDLMDQIASMMADLDVSSTRDQKVYVFKMNNGDPQQAVQVLQNMFQSSGTSRSGSSSSSQNSVLMQRAQNNTTATSTSGSSGSGYSSGFGSSGGTGGRTGGF
jgi:type II secretory pathway component GspD/PulD (secretin)